MARRSTVDVTRETLATAREVVWTMMAMCSRMENITSLKVTTANTVVNAKTAGLSVPKDSPYQLLTQTDPVQSFLLVQACQLFLPALHNFLLVLKGDQLETRL